MNEVWKDIPIVKGYYQVSNLGRVRSIGRTVNAKQRTRKTKGRILKQSLSSGYAIVTLSVNGLRKSIRVHRLVAEAFIPNPINKRTINHIDENKLNNRVDNLEWATDKENANHGNRTTKSSLGRCKPVEQFTLEGEFINTFDSIKSASMKTGISSQRTTATAMGHQKQTHGYKWRYA
ncbi:TPA: HNH endonuclease [Streptococcus agalactiae]|nr:HNH endonuclease [Streptococcus agalactiae]